MAKSKSRLAETKASYQLIRLRLREYAASHIARAAICQLDIETSNQTNALQDTIQQRELEMKKLKDETVSLKNELSLSKRNAYNIMQSESKQQKSLQSDDQSKQKGLLKSMNSLLIKEVSDTDDVSEEDM